MGVKLHARVVLTHGSLGGWLKVVLVLTSQFKIFFISLSFFFLSKNNFKSDACTTLVFSLAGLFTCLALAPPTVSWFGFWFSIAGGFRSQSGGSFPLGLWWLRVFCVLVGFGAGSPGMVLVFSGLEAAGYLGD